MRKDQVVTLRMTENVHVRVWDCSTPELEALARLEKGKLLHEFHTHNLVVTSGLNLVRDLLAGDTTSYLVDFAIGTSNTAAAAGQTALVAEILREDFTQVIKSSEQLTLKYFLSTTQANGNTIREAGLFNDANTMFARVVLSPAIVKDNTVAITFVWSITFTAV